jgi:hypothetical protein
MPIRQQDKWWWNNPDLTGIELDYWRMRQERLEKEREVIQNYKDYVKGMKIDNEKREERIKNIDVNPLTICKPTGEIQYKQGDKIVTNPTFTLKCRDNRHAIMLGRQAIKEDLAKIKIYQQKAIKAQALYDQGITIFEEQEAKTLQERGGYEIRGVPKPTTTPISFSGITENSVLVSWNFDQRDSPITSYHLLIKDEDKGQTKYETNIYAGGGGIVATSTLISNLDSGTNYKAFIIATNEIGNSIEASKGFKTKGVIISTAKKPSSVFIKETEDTTTSGFGPTSTPPPDTKKPDRVFDKETEDTTDSSFISDLIPTIPEVYADTPIITISSDVQAILTKLENNDYTYPSWFNNNIKWVKEGSVTSSEFLNAFNNLLQTGTIIDKTSLPPVIDTSINEKMVSQSIGAFKLENGKVTGDIIYIAEGTIENPIFNPYYYNKQLTSIVQIKDQSGVTIKLKTNNLNFTATERDERISINEGVGDINAVKIEFYVWKSIQNPIAFSIKKDDEIVAKEVGLKSCPIGQHRNFSGKCVPDNKEEVSTSLLGKVMGVTAILGTLALLGSKSR